MPLDPLTQNEYTLSTSENGQEYEIAAWYEWDEVAFYPLFKGDGLGGHPPMHQAKKCIPK